MNHRKPEPPHEGTTRRYRSRGVDVEIREAKDRVELKLDGIPIEVEVVDARFFSHLANMFTGFASIDDLVDSLLANEGRTWTLHGLHHERGHEHGQGGRGGGG